MTLFHSEGTTFSPSFPTRSCPCAEQVIPVAPASSDALWFPLDEAVYAWTSFCTMSMHNAALIATGAALQALSWEQTALRHYTRAHRLRTTQRTDNDLRTVSLLLENTLRNLSEATDRWHRAILWLDRLANNYEDPPEADVLDTVRTLYRQATEFQHRLWTLSGAIQQEQMRLAHPVMEASPAPQEEGSH